MDKTDRPTELTLGETSPDLLLRIAQLTRMLRESMRELGLDQAIREAADAIPDARDRLHYVARMTEQAANRVLNAAEEMQPWQEDLEQDATALTERWRVWRAQTSPHHAEDALELFGDTQQFLADVPEKARASLDTLLEIIMAQDFQDLTGQVIMKMLDVVSAIETELVQVLMDSVPHEQREAASSLINGPQVGKQAAPDVVTDQDQVDDLLASLGL